MPVHIDEALCIRHWDWSETSQTVALFTRDHGVVRALAKGSRRPRSPFSGGIELLTTAEIGLILRPQSELALLTAWDLRELFPALRRVLAAYQAAMYMAELLVQFVRDHDPHPGLYSAAIGVLRAMDSPQPVPGLLVRFQWDLLVECGFRPELGMDVRTGEPLDRAREYIFDPVAGGLSRVGAGQGSSGAASAPRSAGSGWRVRAETVETLRAAARGAAPESVATEAISASIPP